VNAPVRVNLYLPDTYSDAYSCWIGRDPRSLRRRGKGRYGALYGFQLLLSRNIGMPI
jgi:hypothetical protein